MPTTVILKKGRAKPFFYHHPWVFSGAIHRIDGDDPDGSIVEVRADNGDFIGKGYINRQSQIVVRLLTWREDEEVDDGFWRQRIQDAVKLRQEGLRIHESSNAYRLVNSEGDGLPGIIVDKYDRCLVVQFLTLGAIQHKELVCDVLADTCPDASLYERSESVLAEAEGVQSRSGVLRGDEPPDLVEICENGLRFLVDVKRGQKTGTYLDQRENRLSLSRFTRGKRVLDCFCYNGGFAVYAVAKGGAESVTCIDASEHAMQLALRNAALNGVPFFGGITKKADVALRELKSKGDRFDVVVLDPPKFVRSRHGLNRGRRACRETNLLAMQVLEPSGLLFTSSCSQHMDDVTFERTVNEAAVDAGKTLRILHRAGQPPDHPVAAACPETRYLKAYLCYVQDA